jgi:phytanoyl-CoA hydroxylase
MSSTKSPDEFLLKEDGAQILRGVFSKEETQNLKKLVSAIVEYADQGLEDPFERYYMGHISDQGVLYDLFQRHPEFQDFAKNPRILDALVPLLGEDIMLYVNSLIFKPKEIDNEVPWHQDFLNRPDEPPKVICWIALDDATKENGCLRVIPGSHTKGGYDWYRKEGSAHHDRIREGLIDESQKVYLEMQEGDVLLFSQFMVHGSDATNSDKHRRAFRIAYQSLDKVFVSRGAPIVLRGGGPEFLKKKFQKSKAKAKRSSYKTFLEKVGKRLIKMSYSDS